MDNSDYLATRQQRIKEQKSKTQKDQQQLRNTYATWSKTAAYDDLLAFITRTRDSFVKSAQTGIGYKKDGDTTETINLTKDQKLTMLDNAYGFDMIETYIKAKLAS